MTQNKIGHPITVLDQWRASSSICGHPCRRRALGSRRGTVGKWGRRADSTCGIMEEGMESSFCGKSGGTVEFVVTDKAAGSYWFHGEVGGSFGNLSPLLFSLHGYFQSKRCWWSRWGCHVLYYIVFEVIFNIWKNKIEMEENTSIYYTADFASRFFSHYSPSVIADLPLGIVNSSE